MTFSRLLAERLHERTMISVEVNVDVIHSLFEDICSRLDEIDRKVNGIQEAQKNQVGKDEFDRETTRTNKRLDRLEESTKSLSDAAAALKKEVTDMLTAADEKMDAALGRCMIDCRNITKDLAHEIEPEIAKNVMESLPNLDMLIKDNESKQEQIDDLKEQVSALKKKVDYLGENASASRGISDEELKKLRESIAGDRTNAISEEDLHAISDDINGRLTEELEKLRQQLIQYTDGGDTALRDEMGVLANKVNGQIDSMSIDMLKAVTVANDAKNSIEAMQNEILAKMNKVESKANELFAEGQKNLASWNAKIDDLGVATTELKEKLAALQSAVDGIVDRMDASASKDLENTVVKADGQLDVAPILKQLKMFEVKVAGHNDRINALESKETVHPLALSNIRDKLGELEKQTQEASVLLAKCVGDVGMATDTIQKHGDRIGKLESTVGEMETGLAKARSGGETTQRLVDDLGQRLDDVKKQIADISELIRANETKSSDPVAARGRFEAITEFAKGIEREVNKVKGQLTDVVSSLETMSAKTHDGHGSEDSADIAAIRSELKQLWGKLKELTDLEAEKKDDFLPKVDLRSEKPVARVVERAALPRIAVPGKSPREEIRTSDKQDSVIYQLKRAVESQQKSIAQLDDTKADRSATQQLFEQFRIALGELNSRIGSLKKSLIGKVDAADLTNYIGELVGGAGEDETATGIEPVKCLCCGRPRRSVVGAINDPSFIQKIGTSVSSRVLGDGEGQVCFVYGERGDMYIGRSGTGKPVFSRPPEEHPSRPRSALPSVA